MAGLGVWAAKVDAWNVLTVVRNRQQILARLLDREPEEAALIGGQFLLLAVGSSEERFCFRQRLASKKGADFTCLAAWDEIEI